jgi:hypothetical protein
MINQRLTVFDKDLNIKLVLDARTDFIVEDILERSYSRFIASYDTKTEIVVDSDFIHDNQTNFFGIITKVDIKNKSVEIEATSNQYIFNSDIILPSRAQEGNTATIRSYIDNFLKKYQNNVFLNARLPIIINNQVPNDLTFSLPVEARNVNFSNWLNRYIRLYNLKFTAKVSSSSVRNIICTAELVPEAAVMTIDDLRNYIISSDLKLFNEVKNIINVINKDNTNEFIVYYLRKNGTITTNADDTNILTGINETTIMIDEFTSSKALEEAEKLVQNTFKNEIELIVVEEFFNSISLNQKVLFVTKNKLKVTSRLTKKVKEKGIYRLIFGDERNNLTSRIAKKIKEAEYGDL